MGKNYSDNLHSVKEYKERSFIFKQMFDISEKLMVDNKTRFLECLKSAGKIFHGSNYPWSMMKKSSVSRVQKFMYSQILCSLGNVNQNPTSSTYWTQQLDWFKDSAKCKTLDVIDGLPMEFEWNIFPGLSTLQLLQEVQKFMNKMSDLDQFQERIIYMLMFNAALKQCLKMQGKPNNLWNRYVHNINSVIDKISNSKEAKTSITVSIAKLDGGIAESHGETRLQHLHLHVHLQLRNDKRVGDDDNLHYLRKGGDFGFLEGSPENRREVWTGLPLFIHICAVQFVHDRWTHSHSYEEHYSCSNGYVLKKNSDASKSETEGQESDSATCCTGISSCCRLNKGTGIREQKRYRQA